MSLTANKATYVGTFMVSLAMLMYEVLLPRIFTLTMMYHFAFVAISVAMFGLTVGALAVYLLPQFFTLERTGTHLSLFSLLFGFAMVVSLLTHLSMPVLPDMSFQSAYTMGLTYVVVSVPFCFGGICICLILTRFPQQVGRLYAADLAGAAVGCVLTVQLIQFTDGPSAVLTAAYFAAASSLCFLARSDSGKMLKTAVAGNVLLGALALAGTILSVQQDPFLRVRWVGGQPEGPGLYEKWNSFSRIKVMGDPNKPTRIMGWGLSPAYPRTQTMYQLFIKIDNDSGSHMLKFDGDTTGLEHLKHEISNLANHIRPDSRVLSMGVGGGVDIVSALVFGQTHVVGVDFNANILDAVNRVFGNFTGRLDLNPRVTCVHDEARSYIARHKDTYDIIQARQIERPIAAMAGAFVLSENTLFTVEAWSTMLEHLTPRGILTFTRMHFASHPHEMYRITALARKALLNVGAVNPRDHVIIARLPWRPDLNDNLRIDDAVPTAAILVSRSPFSEDDIRTLQELCDRMQFELVLTPKSAMDPLFADFASSEGHDPNDPALALVDVSPPTDDRPFFYNMMKLASLVQPSAWEHGADVPTRRGLYILGCLLLTVLVLTSACIVVPLKWWGPAAKPGGSMPFMVYFGAIGMGFMAVEISQMQRLTMFLGHPTYGLSVVLFSLLLSSGLGSHLSQYARAGTVAPRVLLAALPVVLALFGTVTPYAISQLRHVETTIRIALTVLALFPIGLFMGMAFPLGMKAASASRSALTPWLWGINGATSVIGSVLAFGVSLFFGISATFWLGVGCYVICFAAFVFMTAGEDAL